MQKFCLESTVWRHPYKFGYLGAFPEDGFASISLFAIAEELQEALGDVLAGHRLWQWWGFAYDAKLPGTDIHADDGDVTLNLWITSDAANLDPSTGGIKVWNQRAPKDWSFDDYNSGETACGSSCRVKTLNRRSFRIVRTGRSCLKDTSSIKPTASPSQADSPTGDAI